MTPESAKIQPTITRRRRLGAIPHAYWMASPVGRGQAWKQERKQAASKSVKGELLTGSAPSVD